ncbi:hydrolase [Ascochyta rabiei]|uniref:Hydrolase n=1 Tax=Didymella rabiei TaxID=5454 RepID=A0A163IBH4_DIDRA|nr:hydrolase [Ascochyta rabiei]
MPRSAIASSIFLSISLAFSADVALSYDTNSLKWAPCDLDFSSEIQLEVAAHAEPLFCATLPVPLDYTNRKNGQFLDLQLIKIKATKEPFKGSVLTNPGGPGGSGVDWIATDGPSIRNDLGGHHDVIGFDPRGTGRTIPFYCIQSNSTSPNNKRAEYNFTIPQDDMYSVLKAKAWRDGGKYAEDCASTPGNSDIAPYISTPFVARDMLKIIDALGEDKLQYWGISYGTVLGQTFAGMFPDRVKRIVLDSTVRFDDYHAGHWITVTRDTERALVNFFTECVNVGSELCPIANFTGPNATPEDLHNEYAKVFQELLDDPVFMPDDYHPLPWWQPGSITISQILKYSTLASAYRPRQFGELDIIVDIALRRAWDEWIALSTPLPSNSTTPEVPWNLGSNAFHGITCGDGAFRANTPEDMHSLVLAQASAGTFSDGFAPQIWPCAQWKFEVKERYTGPFTAINTSYPILFVNGNHDPITPLSTAYEASANFPSSRLVVQNGHGHGTRNHPSACTNRAIADYFNDGTLPAAGTVCQTDKTAYGVFEDWLALQLGNSTDNSTIAKRSSENSRKFILV